MTRFEEMLLERLDTLAGEVGELATAVARLEEREKVRVAAVSAAAPASARPRRGWRDNGGLYLSNAAITAVVSALLTLLARPVAGPDAPRPPTPVEAPK